MGSTRRALEPGRLQLPPVELAHAQRQLRARREGAQLPPALVALPREVRQEWPAKNSGGVMLW